MLAFALALGVTVPFLFAAQEQRFTDKSNATLGTIDSGGNAVFPASMTASAFFGDGSNLTGVGGGSPVTLFYVPASTMTKYTAISAIREDTVSTVLSANSSENTLYTLDGASIAHTTDNLGYDFLIAANTGYYGVPSGFAEVVYIDSTTAVEGTAVDFSATFGSIKALAGTTSGAYKDQLVIVGSDPTFTTTRMALYDLTAETLGAAHDFGVDLGNDIDFFLLPGGTYYMTASNYNTYLWYGSTPAATPTLVDYSVYSNLVPGLIADGTDLVLPTGYGFLWDDATAPGTNVAIAGPTNAGSPVQRPVLVSGVLYSNTRVASAASLFRSSRTGNVTGVALPWAGIQPAKSAVIKVGNKIYFGAYENLTVLDVTKL